MAKLVCNDYGFECDFVSEGDEIENVLKMFGEHTEEEHTRLSHRSVFDDWVVGSQ